MVLKKEKTLANQSKEGNKAIIIGQFTALLLQVKLFNGQTGFAEPPPSLELYPLSQRGYSGS